MLQPISSLTRRIAGKGARAWDIHAIATRDQAAGKDVVILSIGDPEFDTPEPVRLRAIEAMQAGDTHYVDMRGKQTLRESIARHHQRRTGQQVDASNVVVLSGAQSGLFSASLCLLDNGDEAISFDPIYTTYEASMAVSGARVVSLPLNVDNDFHPDVDQIAAAITPKTRALFLANPSNPTGGVLTREEVQGIAELAMKHDFWIVADEVYSDLIFEGSFHHFASVPGLGDRLVTVSSLSKSHAITGWRLGWVVAPAELTEHLENLILCMLYGVPGFIQEAAIVALEECDDSTLAMRDIYCERRDRIMELLSGIKGLKLIKPAAGMFMLADVSAFGLDSGTFMERLYHETGVSILDARAFGDAGSGFVRISFAPAMQVLEEGCRRIARFVETLR